MRRQQNECYRDGQYPHKHISGGIRSAAKWSGRITMPCQCRQTNKQEQGRCHFAHFAMCIFCDDDGAGTETSMRCPLFWRQRLGALCHQCSWNGLEYSDSNRNARFQVLIARLQHVLFSLVGRCETELTDLFPSQIRYSKPASPKRSAKLLVRIHAHGEEEEKSDLDGSYCTISTKRVQVRVLNNYHLPTNYTNKHYTNC